MRYLWLLLVMSVVSVSYADIYQYTDAQGNTVFSDQKPSKGAIKVTPSAGNTVTIPPVKESVNNTDEKSKPQSGPVYTVAISSPSNEQTFWNTRVIDVAVSHSSLRLDMSIILSMDGVIQGQPRTVGTFTLDNVDRGQHTLVAYLVGSQGKHLAESKPVVFYLHQTALNAKPKIQTKPAPR